MSIFLHHELQPEIKTFLTTAELYHLSHVTKGFYNDTRFELINRKQERITEVCSYFYHMYTKTFSLRPLSTIHYIQNVKFLFMILPEAFEFIETNNVIHLDFNSLIGRESVQKVVNNNIRSMIEEVMHFISENKTLESCNLGFFQSYLNKSHLEALVQHHPTLSYLSIKPDSIRIEYTHEPTSLYKKIDGTVEWAFYAPLDWVFGSD